MPGKQSADFWAEWPTRAELLDMVYKSLLDMVYKSAEALGEEFKRESLGFNSSRLHPDIYMDELLRGIRVIHQILPAITKKLGMDAVADRLSPRVSGSYEDKIPHCHCRAFNCQVWNPTGETPALFGPQCDRAERNLSTTDCRDTWFYKVMMLILCWLPHLLTPEFLT